MKIYINDLNEHETNSSFSTIIKYIALVIAFAVSFIIANIPLGKLALVNVVGYVLCCVVAFITVFEIVKLFMLRNEE